MEDKVLIVGGNHHNTLGVIRSFGRKGIEPDVIIIGVKQNPFVEKSKYIGKISYCETLEDGINRVISDYSNQYKKIVVIPTSDISAAAFDKEYGKLPSNVIIPGAKGKLSELMDKDNMCQLAQSFGLIVPVYKKVNTGDVTCMNLTDVKYPCITKAISSLKGGKDETIIAHDENVLLSFLKGINQNASIIIEEYIEKEIEFQFFGLSLNGGKEIIIPGHSHIHRPGIQNEYYFPYILNDESFKDTENKVRKYLSTVNFTGLFSAEFIRGKDGVDYFLEINFRNDGNAICVTDAGYNLPYIWYLYNIGGDYESEIKNSSFQEVNFCPDVVYLFHMLNGELSLKEWYRTVKKSNSFTSYDKDDIKPFYALLSWQKIGIFLSFIKLTLRKMHVLK